MRNSMAVISSFSIILQCGSFFWLRANYGESLSDGFISVFVIEVIIGMVFSMILFVLIVGITISHSLRTPLICGYSLHAIKDYPSLVGPALASYLAMLRYQAVVKKVRISNKKIYLTSAGICLFYFIIYFFIWPISGDYFGRFRIIQICELGYIDYNTNISLGMQL